MTSFDGKPPGYVITRDFFAGLALAGLLADPDMDSRPEIVAMWAYDYADSMMAERQKREENEG